MKHLALSFMLIGWSALAAAEIYQWTDSEGKTHFGDGAAKQPGQKAEKLDIKTDAAKPDPEAERTRQQLRMLNKMSSEQRETEARQAAKLEQQQQQMQQRCREANDQIRFDKEVAVLFRYDDAGNRVIYTAEERTAYREQLQAIRQQYCGAE